MISILQYDFMRHAIIAGMAIAVVAPLIGMFLVVRRYSLMADTLSHVALVGVAIGVLLHSYPVIFALLVSIVASLGIEYVRRKQQLFGESVLALFLSSSLAIASLLFSLSKGSSGFVLSFLFGSIATVSRTDVWVICTLAIVVVAVIVGLYKEFFLVSFDEELASAQGLPANILNNLLVVLASVTVSVSMRIVGSLLVGALMVIPVVTAMQFRKGFFTTIVLSGVFSLVAVLSGLVISYYFDLASGGTIVTISLGMFLLSLPGSGKK